MLIRTVRGRLTLGFSAALSLALLLFAGGVFILVQTSLLGQVADRAAQELTATTAFVRNNPGDVAELGEVKPDSLLLVLKGDDIEYRSAPWQRIGLPGAGEIHADEADWLWETPSDHHYRLAAQTVRTAERTFVVVVASDEEPARRGLATLAWTIGLSIPIAIGLSILGGYLLAGRLLSPVRRMAKAAERIGIEGLSERLPVENPADEFGRLATVTNKSLDRLQSTVERQHRFTADASHEMRTPLTAIRTAGEVALRREQKPVEYRETIGSMLEGVGRLTDLIDRLLVLARADAGTQAVKPELLDAAEVVNEAVDLLQPVAEQKQIAIQSNALSGLSLRADRVLLRQAVLNLIDNAVKYTPSGGTVSIDVSCQGDSVFIVVSDTGPGIATEYHERVFERFFRADSARSRGETGVTGGAGLGLAIAKWAVEACGGRITLESTVGDGSTFTIIMPSQRSGGSHP